jgi:hypothetical protein
MQCNIVLLLLSSLSSLSSSLIVIINAITIISIDIVVGVAVKSSREYNGVSIHCHFVTSVTR